MRRLGASQAAELKCIFGSLHPKSLAAAGDEVAARGVLGKHPRAPRTHPTGNENNFGLLILDYSHEDNIHMIFRLFFFGINTVVDGRDLLLVERSAITAHHMESKRFRVDFLSCVPIDLVGLFVGHWSYLRVPHVLRFSVGFLSSSCDRVA